MVITKPKIPVVPLPSPKKPTVTSRTKTASDKESGSREKTESKTSPRIQTMKTVVEGKCQKTRKFETKTNFLKTSAKTGSTSTLNSVSSRQKKLKQGKYFKMNRVSIGQHVEIKRSDGRIHTAIVVGLSEPEQLVKVEWFEQGETKGKEVEFSTLLKINPSLRPDEPETKKKEIKISSTNTVENGKNLSNGKDKKIPSESDKPNGSQMLKRTILGDTSYMDKTLPNINKHLNRSRHHTVDVILNPGKKQNLKENDEPVRSVPPRAPSPPKLTHEKIKELEAKREERRAKQSEFKRQKHVQKEIDKSNPNWQFLQMINEYRSQVDYRPLSATDPVAENRISVCVRKRPLDKKEISKKEIDVVTIPNKDHLVVHQPQVKVDLTKYLENQKFRFDYTFDEDSTNEMVYRFTAQPLVKTLFEGGFATCFAYGQTGSGKTHTMCGAFQGKSQDCTMGIYALTAADIFQQLRKPQFSKLILKCSFFELYGGKVFDLLGKRAALRILEDGNKSVQVVGLSEVDVNAPEDVMELIKKGSAQRSAGTTSANMNSSRSHAVFQMVLRKGTKEDLYGKISLIDLAGNERGADTTNSDRQTRMEGADINKSLLALKECIRSMSMNKNYVPFRLSKLTLVLRDSFVNENTRTCMIAMVSPGLNCVENTLNTLRYADRVKELGSDEDGPAKPVPDSDFMFDGTGSDDDDFKLLKHTIKDEETMESTILLNRIMTAQEKTHDDFYNLQEINDKLGSLVEESQTRECDLEHYAKDLISTCEKSARAVKILQDAAKDLLQKIQKEQEQSRKRFKK